MQPAISDEAWGLLARLDRERLGGPAVTPSNETVGPYTELVERGLVRSRRITKEGLSALIDRLSEWPSGSE